METTFLTLINIVRCLRAGFHSRMAEKTRQKEKDPVNIVHQNAIFRELIKKEQRNQKLYTSYGVNPYKKSAL